MRASALFVCVALAVGALACASPPPPPVVAPPPPPPPPAPIPPSLYARLGGQDGIAGIVESWMSNAVADGRVKKLFAKTKGPRLERLKDLLELQLCEISGGDCEYPGKTMKDAHAKMPIAGAQFDAFLQDASLALQEKQVDADTQKELMGKLAAMKGDIVHERKGKNP